VGFQGDAGGSVPLGVVVTTTPSSESNSKRLQLNILQRMQIRRGQLLFRDELFINVSGRVRGLR